MEDKETSSPSANNIKKKKDDKYKKRDPRYWDNLKKQIVSMTEEQKLEYISEKYNELYNEHRNLNAVVQAREKQITSLQKDLDREQGDLTKAILAKGHLESLCRELQKQNKVIKEENIARVKEEEERRREVANTFTERLNALTNLITESKDKSNKVKEENQSMTDKLSELYEQYRKREDYHDNMAKQLDLQKKLAESMIKKNQVEFETERQLWLEEKKSLTNDLQRSESQSKILQAHVDLYKQQCDNFEATMIKSKKVFDSVKEEKLKMNKQISSLQAELNEWRSQWQNSAKSLITLSEQHTYIKDKLNAAEKKIALLQKLCRQLQSERTIFLQQLKENNITPKQPPEVNFDTQKNASDKENLTLKQKHIKNEIISDKVKKPNKTELNMDTILVISDNESNSSEVERNEREETAKNNEVIEVCDSPESNISNEDISPEVKGSEDDQVLASKKIKVSHEADKEDSKEAELSNQEEVIEVCDSPESTNEYFQEAKEDNEYDIIEISKKNEIIEVSDSPESNFSNEYSQEAQQHKEDDVLETILYNYLEGNECGEDIIVLDSKTDKEDSKEANVSKQASKQDEIIEVCDSSPESNFSSTDNSRDAKV